MLFDAGDSSSGGSRTPALLIDSPGYDLQLACTPEAKYQASTRPLEAQNSTQTTNGYSSLNSTSAVSNVFPVLPHDPEGNLAAQFSPNAVAHSYNHHDFNFNRQPCPEQTPAELFSISKPNDEPRITSSKVQCWDHGCNGKRFSTSSNLFRHERERRGLGANAVCASCGKTFTRTTALKYHIKRSRCSKFQGESRVGKRNKSEKLLLPAIGWRVEVMHHYTNGIITAT
ncbi:hypothetical protein PENNAL_c0109G04624 [Penicillium nalgiovense]|uniref:C2H2-type domain-containing protein n=1 Tax=Penicillium nalgiovense TaxID=60175 RepID=A0A1V6X7S9_PENNA|nr:hypothetical protein PENNAL_c0109G04624 [Penicillium nalgiovense]